MWIKKQNIQKLMKTINPNSHIAKNLQYLDNIHSELSVKLMQNLSCFQLQVDMIKKLYYSRQKDFPELYQETLQMTIKKISQFSQTESLQLTKKLLKKQVELQNQGEDKIRIFQYQQRIKVLLDNLLQKETNLANQHVGLKKKQQPTPQALKSLYKKNYINNKTFQMINIRSKLRKDLQLCAGKAESQLSQSTKDDAKPISDQKSEIQGEFKTKKLILISSQRQSYLQNRTRDPVIQKMFSLIQQQDKKSIKMSKQYQILHQRYIKINQQHKRMKKLYQLSK